MNGNPVKILVLLLVGIMTAIAPSGAGDAQEISGCPLNAPLKKVKKTAAEDAPATPPKDSKKLLVFVSSFAPGNQGGILSFQLDVNSGMLQPSQRTIGVENPFFLALSRDQKFLYSIHAKQFGGKENEEVAAYQLVGSSGELKLLNRQSTHGSASCYLHCNSSWQTLVVANYTTGNVASFPVGFDGSLGEAVSIIQHVGSSVDPKRQKEPHPHAIVISPDSRFALVPDLGLDQILSYRLDIPTSKLTPNNPPFIKVTPGAGPRHLTFHPNGKFVYVINEISNSVSIFGYEPESGTLTEKQTISTLPDDFNGKSACADLKITPNGRFLYGTNRGHDSIAMYRIDDDGLLTLIGIEPSLGKGPQNLAITPGGELLLCANMSGKNVAVFKIESEIGDLKSVGSPFAVLSPSCIMIVP